MNYAIRFVVLLLVLLTGCQSSEVDREQLLPRSNKVLNQIVILCPSGECNADIKEAVKFIFGSSIKGLYEPEPAFDLIYVSDIHASKIFSSQPYVIKLNLDANSKTDKIGFQKNKWAKQQLYFQFEASDQLALQALILNRGSAVLDLIEKHQLERFRVELSKEVQPPNDRTLSLSLAEGFELVDSDTNYSYYGAFGQGLCKAGTQINCRFQLGYLVFEKAYNGSQMFAEDSLVTLQNTLTKQLILGPEKEHPTYMETVSSFPMSRDTVSQGQTFVVRHSGWWDMVGATMGGPYRLYAFVNPRTGKLNAILSFAFAPGLEKRDYLLKMDHTTRLLIERFGQE